MHLFKKLAKAFMIILLAAVTGFALAGCGGSGASSSSAKAPAAGAAKTPAKPGDKLIIRMLDIGQGDAFLLEKDGKFAMIDTGDVEHREALVKYLHEYGVKELSNVIITHPHADHMGGMKAVFDNIKVDNIYDDGVPTNTNTYKTYLKNIKTKNIPFHIPKAGETIALFDGVDFHVAGPVSEIKDQKGRPDLNNNSIVGKLTYGDFSMLFTGDAEKEEESAILKSGFGLKSDVLKVGHHGSNTSSSYLFLRQVMPSYAVISCGRDNAYGHPHQEVLARLRDIGAAVYRTDESGTIVCRSNGERVAFETEKGKKPTATPRKGQSVGYIGNIKSKKFHLSTCSSVQDIQQSNRITFATRAAAVKQGYSPCKACRP